MERVYRKYLVEAATLHTMNERRVLGAEQEGLCAAALQVAFEVTAGEYVVIAAQCLALLGDLDPLELGYAVMTTPP